MQFAMHPIVKHIGLILPMVVSMPSHAALDSKSVEQAFECSNYALIASRTAPNEDSEHYWVENTKDWLDRAYHRGGTIYDYVELPENISKKFAGLLRYESFIIAKDEYEQLKCKL